MGETAALSSGADLCHTPNPRQTAGAAIQTTSIRLECQECRSAGILARIAPVGPNTPSMFCNVNTNRRGWVKRDVIRLGLVSRLIRRGPEGRCRQGCPRTDMPRQTCLTPDPEGHPEGRARMPADKMPQRYRLATVMTAKSCH